MPYKDPNKYREYIARYGRTPEQKAKRAGYQRENAEKISLRIIERVYGLTPEAYRALIASQDGCCKICRQKPTGKRHHGKLFVDHDHNTGKVRGMLCHHCNAAIGYMKDQPGLLRLAAEYLERVI